MYISLIRDEYRGMVVLVALVVSCVPVWAVDGQVDVLPDGATTYIINSPGSYVLVTSVNMTADVDCIQINADNVTLDLNGHSLVGTGNGSASGVIQTLGSRAKVFNGTIQNFDKHGVSLHPYAQVWQLIIRGCCGAAATHEAIRVDDNAIIRQSTVVYNFGLGIVTGEGSLVENCLVSDNRKGIIVGGGSTVQNCIVMDNVSAEEGIGILASGINTMITKNVCHGNRSFTDGMAGYGIKGNIATTVSHNMCFENRGSGPDGHGYGIFVETDSLVIHNTCKDNLGEGERAMGVGIRVGANCQVIDNLCQANRGEYVAGSGSAGRGIIVAFSGNVVRENLCQGNDGFGGGTGLGSVGIYVAPGGHGNRIEGNNITGHQRGILAYGLQVDGDRNHILSNTFYSNTNASILLNGNNNYYAANIHPAAEVINDSGTSNLAGTMPGANVAVP